MESRETVLMNVFAGHQWRYRLNGPREAVRRRRWEVGRE